MSRYTIPTNNFLKYACVVGYDNPLETFFAQVIDIEAEEYNESLPPDSDDPEKNEMIVWNGTRSKQIQTVEELQETIKEYATIPPYIIDKLNRDKSESPGPNNFQKRMISLVEGLN